LLETGKFQSPLRRGVAQHMVGMYHNAAAQGWQLGSGSLLEEE